MTYVMSTCTLAIRGEDVTTSTIDDGLKYQRQWPGHCKSLRVHTTSNVPPRSCVGPQTCWSKQALMVNVKIMVRNNAVCTPAVQHCMQHAAHYTQQVPSSSSSSSRMPVMNHNWSTRKQHLHLHSAAGISRHSALSQDRIRQYGTTWDV